MSIKDQDNDQLMFAFYLDIADWLPCKNLAILSKKDSRISGYNTVFCENIWFKLLFFSLIYCKLATELFKTKTMSNSISNINSGTFFECKVRYNRVRENGLEKKVTEPYIVKAFSFSEAESRMIKFIEPFTSGEFTISDIKRCKFSEIIEDKSGDMYYKCILCFKTLDEKPGKEKKTKNLILIQGSSVDDVIVSIKKYMNGSMSDYKITKIEETAIMDVCNEID